MRILPTLRFSGFATALLAFAGSVVGADQTITGNLLMLSTTEPPPPNWNNAQDPGPSTLNISGRDFYDELRYSVSYHPNMYWVGAGIFELNKSKIISDGDGYLTLQSATPWSEITFVPGTGQSVVISGRRDTTGWYSWRSDATWKYISGYLIYNGENYTEFGLSLYYDPATFSHKGVLNFNEGEGEISMQSGGAVVVRSGHQTAALELEGAKGIKSQNSGNAARFPRGDGTWQSLVPAAGGTFSGGVTVASDNAGTGGMTLGSGAAADGANLRLLAAAGQAQWNLDNSGGVLRFFTETAPGSGGSVKMTMTSGGSVGIGATAPAARLEVSNSDNIPALIAKNTHASPTSSVAVFQRVSPVAAASQSPANALVAIRESGGYPLAVTNASGSVSHLLVDNNGRVGVGTSQLLKKFQVAGATALQGDAEITGNLSVEGDAALGMVTSSFFNLGISGIIEGINNPMSPELWVGGGSTLTLAGSDINLMSQRIALGIDYGYQPTIEVTAAANWDTAQNIVLTPFGTGCIIHQGKTQLNGDVAVSGALTVNGQPVATANQLASYQSSTGSGAGLTQLNASALSSGTVSAARLPADVTRLGPSIDLPAESTGNLDWSRVSGRPATLGGYGIGNAVAKDAGGNVTMAGNLSFVSGNLTGVDNFDANSAYVFSALIEELEIFTATVESALIGEADIGSLLANTISFGPNGYIMSDGNADDPILTIQAGVNAQNQAMGAIYMAGQVVLAENAALRIDGATRVAPQGDIDMGSFQEEP